MTLPSALALGSLSVPLAPLLSVTLAVSVWLAFASVMATLENGATAFSSVVETVVGPGVAVIGTIAAVRLTLAVAVLA